MPKLLAVITIAAPFVGVSAWLTAQVAFLDDLARHDGGRPSRRCVGVACTPRRSSGSGWSPPRRSASGSLYIVIWEGFFSGFVAGVRLLSIRHYAIGVMHGLDARRFAAVPHLGPVAAVIVSLLVFAGFLALSIRRLRRMDVP